MGQRVVCNAVHPLLNIIFSTSVSIVVRIVFSAATGVLFPSWDRGGLRVRSTELMFTYFVFSRTG